MILQEESESNITTTLYILTILTKLMTLNGYEKGYEETDVKKAHYLVHQLCALRMRLTDGQTLLHLAVNANTPVDDFHTNDVCKCVSNGFNYIQIILHDRSTNYP